MDGMFMSSNPLIPIPSSIKSCFRRIKNEYFILFSIGIIWTGIMTLGMLAFSPDSQAGRQQQGIRFLKHE